MNGEETKLEKIKTNTVDKLKEQKSDFNSSKDRLSKIILGQRGSFKILSEVKGNLDIIKERLNGAYTPDVDIQSIRANFSAMATKMDKVYNSLNEENVNLGNRKEQLRGIIQKWRDLEKIIKVIEELDKFNKNRQDKISLSILLSNAKNTTEEIKNLKSKLVKSNSQLSSKIEEIDKLNSSISELSDKNNLLSSEIQSSSDKVTELLNFIEQLETNINKNSEIFEGIKNEITTIESNQKTNEIISGDLKGISGELIGLAAFASITIGTSSNLFALLKQLAPLV